MVGDVYIIYNDNKVYVECVDSFNGTIQMSVGGEVIYSRTKLFESNNLYWFKPNRNLRLCDYIDVVIKNNNDVIYNNQFEMNIVIKTVVDSIGDLLNITPIIRELSKAHNKKIYLFTKIPDVFINNPYIIDIYNYDHDHKNYLVYNISLSNINNYYKQRLTHLVDSSSIDIGFTLPSTMKSLEFYPNKRKDMNLPNKYICIAPSITWETRTYPKNDYQELINKINNIGYTVVIVGKTSESEDDQTLEYRKKSSFNNFDGDVIDMVDKTDMSDAWHIINESLLFITTDSGLLHLAGTTDVNILMIATNINPYSRLPFRNGSQDYKQKYCVGVCEKFCASNMLYSVKVVGDISYYPYSQNTCMENYDEYKCFPTPDKVFEYVEYFL